jgi:phosphate:Na+ symporter
MNILNSEYLQIFLGLLSALILFLYAIENLSKEIQELASERFRSTIANLAKNKYIGVLLGAITTAIIQSSSIVTVMAVILVNTGIISFRSSLGIVLGSNIGTTITAQLAVLNSTILASLLIIIGSLFGILGKKFKMFSKPIFFLGFILFSLTLLSSTLEPLKNNPDVIAIFAELSDPILAFFVSALFTMVIHSSSITSGIIVIFAQSGLVPISVAIPMILGANLGSSITALLASSRLNLHAKRVGFANFLFRALGSILFMFLLSPLTWIVESLASNPGVQTALAHLVFNILNSLIFLFLLKPFENLIITLIKGTEEEILFETKYLKKNGDKKLKNKLRNIKKEIAYSIENTIKIYQSALSVYYNPSGTILMNIKKLETLNDFLDDEITNCILELSKLKLNSKYAQNTIILIKISNTIEQLGDLGQDFSEVFLRMHKLDISSVSVNIERLTDIHNRLIHLFRDIEKNIIDTTPQKLDRIKEKEEEIYILIRKEYKKHIYKLQNEEKYDGNIFVDAISIIESSVSKIRDIRKLLQQKS